MIKAINIKATGIALAAVCALAGLVATNAVAAGGPVWIVLLGEVLHELAAGEKEALTSEGGEFKLNGVTNILCKSEQDTGQIIGGNPGTDETTIKFLECAVEGKTVAECGASNTAVAGEVEVVGIHTLLVYGQGKPESASEAFVAFIPGGTSNLFVEFTLKGTNCALLNNVKVNVNATGTEITEPAFNKKCGVLAKVGTLNAGAFVATVSGEEAVVGALNTEELLTEAELWLPTAKVFNLIICKLEAFAAEASEIGVSDVTLVSGNQFGWEV